MHMCIAVAIALLLISPLIGDDPPDRRLPKNADEIEVTLEVVDALEEGPVICKVHLRNKTGQTLSFSEPAYRQTVFCQVVGRPWKWRSSEFQCGVFDIIVPIPTDTEFELAPKDTRSWSYHLHRDFLHIPSGQIEVEYGFQIWPKRPINDGSIDSHTRLIPRSDREILFEIRKRRKIPILPATAENVAAATAKLEEAIAIRRGRDDRKIPRSDPYWEAVERIDTSKDCRHPEFVPHLLSIIENRLYTPSQVAEVRLNFIQAIYDSYPTPEQGFGVLFDYLKSHRPILAEDILTYWARVRRNSEWAQSRLSVNLDVDFASDKEADFNWVLAELADRNWKLGLWCDSKRHADCRLDESQVARLMTLSDPTLQTLIFTMLKGDCSDEWTVKFLLALKLLASPLSPEEMADLKARMDDDRFEVRERATREYIDNWYRMPAREWSEWQRNVSPEVSRRILRARTEIARDDLSKQKLFSFRFQSAIGDRVITQPAIKPIMTDILKADRQSYLTQILYRQWIEHYAVREKKYDRWNEPWKKVDQPKQPAKPACQYVKSD